MNLNDIIQSRRVKNKQTNVIQGQIAQEQSAYLSNRVQGPEPQGKTIEKNMQMTQKMARNGKWKNENKCQNDRTISKHISRFT